MQKCFRKKTLSLHDARCIQGKYRISSRLQFQKDDVCFYKLAKLLRLYVAEK